MTKNEDISNPFEVTESKTLAVQNIVDKNKYLTILFFSPHYTQLDTCQKFHPHNEKNDGTAKGKMPDMMEISSYLLRYIYIYHGV